MCNWSLEESYSQAQLTDSSPTKATAAATANSRSQDNIYVVIYFDMWLDI